MDWMRELEARLKRKNQILFAPDGSLLKDLAQLTAAQSHRSLILWSFELAGQAADLLHKRHPNEPRPRQALAAAGAWAAGKTKMPVAKRAILQAHAAAKQMQTPEDSALCHAVGQACSVVHTAGHAMGFPVYELTALVWRHGPQHCQTPVEARSRQYIDRLLYWQSHSGNHATEWAAFLPD